MASRKDFAQKNKSASAASRSKSSAANRSAPRRRSPVLLGLVAVVAVGSLSYGLFQLAGLQSATPASEPTGPQAVTVVPAPSQTKADQTRPVQRTDTTSKPAMAVVPEPVVKDTAAATRETAQAQQNRFDFYDMLPKSEVEAPTVEAYKSTPRTAKLEQSYLLQAGSFRDPADAERMRAQLLLAGLPNVRTSKSEGSNGIWYRVRTGPFDNRAAINKAQSKMAQMRIESMQIQQ